MIKGQDDWMRSFLSPCLYSKEAQMVEVGMTILSLSLILDGFKSALRQVMSWHAPSNARCCTGHPSSFPLLQKPTSWVLGLTHSYPALPQRAQASSWVLIPHSVLSATTMSKRRAAWTTNCKNGACIKANQVRISREYF